MRHLVRTTFFSMALPLVSFVVFSADAVAQAADVAGDAQSDVPLEPSSVQTSGAQDLDTVVIAGRYPGPGLWKIRSGERTLWILGTQNPLPKRMEWDSANVERKVAAAQELLLPPTVKMDADIGFFRGLTLLPSLFKARKNPNDKTLRDMVPMEQYARWQVLKARYIGSDRGVESWRPMFAALELYNKAIARSGMTVEPVVSDAVEKAAKRSKVKITTPVLTIKIADPKKALREFSSEALNDQECFRRTLDRIETDLGAMAGRANAWAEGDIQALRDLPYESQYSACRAAFTETGIARKQGMQDMQARMEAAWFAAAEKSLSQNLSTFAVMPVSQLMRSEGLLARLAAKGYTIEAP